MTEQDQRMEERVDADIPEAETGGPLSVDDQRTLEFLECDLADARRPCAEAAIMAERFEAQEASVGWEANLPECGKIKQRTDAVRPPLAYAEVATNSQSSRLLMVVSVRSPRPSL